MSFPVKDGIEADADPKKNTSRNPKQAYMQQQQRLLNDKNDSPRLHQLQRPRTISEFEEPNSK